MGSRVNTHYLNPTLLYITKLNKMRFLSLLTVVLLSSVVDCNVRHTKIVCEGGQMHLECPADKQITAVRANFGRLNADVCDAEGATNWSTRCIEPTSLRKVNSLCGGQAACVIDVTAAVFGDACPGSYKYLEVHYMCKKRAAKSIVNAGSLPPWLLKMTATTAKPAAVLTPSKTTTETPQNPFIQAKIEEIVSEVNGFYKFEENRIDDY